MKLKKKFERIQISIQRSYLRTTKILFFNLLLLSGLLLLVEAALWHLYPDYKYYYRTHPGQPNLEEILAKTDTCWLTPHPKLGWVCQQQQILEFPTPPTDGISYQINEQGFRNAFNFTDSFPPHKKRILLLGDSFMFGIYLPEQQTIASRLQVEKGEDYLFFNVAIPAWGLDQMYLAYLEYIELINPDQVILAFVDDDLMRSLEILFHGCGRKPSLKIQKDQLVANEDNPLLWEYLCWNNQTGNRLLLGFYQRQAARLAEFMLVDIIHRESAFGRTPAFVRIPALVDLQNEVPRPVFSMVDFMKSQEVPYLELYDSLARLPAREFEAYYIPDDGHFTAEGAGMMAAYILNLIK
ncbi:MAG: hypothetical protein ACI8P3_000450 [Saprospiraceae bacterium]|jgi:hypothetical protein